MLLQTARLARCGQGEDPFAYKFHQCAMLSRHLCVCANVLRRRPYTNRSASEIRVSEVEKAILFTRLQGTVLNARMVLMVWYRLGDKLSPVGWCSGFAYRKRTKTISPSCLCGALSMCVCCLCVYVCAGSSKNGAALQFGYSSRCKTNSIWRKKFTYLVQAWQHGNILLI